MKTLLVWITAAGIILGLTNCVSPAASRIAKNPQAFEKLSAHEKVFVMHGEVAQGMSKDAVMLAWGRPDRETRDTLSGIPCDKWVYTGYVPVEGCYINAMRPGQPPTTSFTGPLLVGDSTAGNYVVDRVRAGYFKDNSLFAWDLVH